MPPRLNFYIDESAIDQLSQLARENPTKAQQAIANFWLQNFENSALPIHAMFPDGTSRKNKALLIMEAREDAETLLMNAVNRYEALVAEKELQIGVLTRALADLQNSTPPAPEEEIANKSMLLAFYNAASAKPGAFGFSIDIKALAKDTREIVDERTRPIVLGLNTPKDKKG